MSVSDSFAYNIAVTKTQRPRSEWHVGRHGRKAWLKDVAERRGLGVAGKRGRKAWLKGVVLRRACRIEDVGLEVSHKSVCLCKGPAPSVCLNKGPTSSCRRHQHGPAKECQKVNVRTGKLRVPQNFSPLSTI